MSDRETTDPKGVAGLRRRINNTVEILQRRGDEEPWASIALLLRDCADELAALSAQPWQPIETALKGRDRHGLSHVVILGFAADEEGYSLPSREGFWSHALKRWASTLDPQWENSPQPTHWMPLPAPPGDSCAEPREACAETPHTCADELTATKETPRHEQALQRLLDVVNAARYRPILTEVGLQLTYGPPTDKYGWPMSCDRCANIAEAALQYVVSLEKKNGCGDMETTDPKGVADLIAKWREAATLEDREAGNALQSPSVGPANLSYHTACARRRIYTLCADALAALTAPQLSGYFKTDGEVTFTPAPACSPWQPIATAPTDGTRVIACGPGMAVAECEYRAAWQQYGAGWYRTNQHPQVEPTLWVPLPDPPGTALPAPQETRERPDLPAPREWNALGGSRATTSRRVHPITERERRP